MNETGGSPAAPAAEGASRARPPWYRRRGLLVGAGAALVVAVAVVTDLPTHASNASDIATEQAVMSEVNSDMAGCAYGARESFSIRADQLDGTLTPSDLHQAPGLLRDDLAACSFTDSSIFDLSDIEPPSSPAGKRLGALLNSVTLWATSDALGAISDLQTLLDSPHDQKALSDLSRRERSLAEDRAAARADIAAADRLLGTHLTEPDLPALPETGAVT